MPNPWTSWLRSWQASTKRADVRPAQALTIFLTRATGFLSAYLIDEMLGRQKHNTELIAHVCARMRCQEPCCGARALTALSWRKWRLEGRVELKTEQRRG
jgi:hypothetical protein